MPCSTTPRPPTLPHQKGPGGCGNVPPSHQNLSFHIGCKHCTYLPGFPSVTRTHTPSPPPQATVLQHALCDHLVTHNRKIWLTSTLCFYAGWTLTPITIVCCPVEQQCHSCLAQAGQTGGKDTVVREVAFPRAARAACASLCEHSTAQKRIIKGCIIKLLIQPGHPRNVTSPEPDADASRGKAGGTDPQQLKAQLPDTIAQTLCLEVGVPSEPRAGEQGCARCLVQIQRVSAKAELKLLSVAALCPHNFKISTAFQPFTYSCIQGLRLQIAIFYVTQVN